MQANMPLYLLGKPGDDILTSFGLSAEKSKKYDTVKSKFNNYFNLQSNGIYDRAIFNRRCQQPAESIHKYVTALHMLAQKCSLGQLAKELIRDRIVVGLQDRVLSKRVRLDPELMLKKAITLARNAETVKVQQKALREPGTG